MACMEVWGGNERAMADVAMPGIDASIYSEPHDSAAGGDIYYVSMCGGGRIARFLLADVAGHGTAVNDTATALRNLMRKYINTLNPTRFARAINREFTRRIDANGFATALVATYFAPSDHMIVCNAGHPRPLWYHAKSRTWQFLDHGKSRGAKVANIPLGVMEPIDYVLSAVQLEVGDLVLIYTDWLVDVRNPNGEPLGEEGLLAAVRELELCATEDFPRALFDIVARYRGTRGATDDQTLLLLRHNGSDPPRQTIWQKMRMTVKMLGLG